MAIPRKFATLLFILFSLISCQLIGQTTDYDTISQQYLETPQAEADNALLKIQVLDTKQVPMRMIPVYVRNTDENVVYFRKTDLKGNARFLVPIGRHYAIDINKSIDYANVNIADNSYLTQNLTITYDPKWNNKPVPKNIPDVIPGDTVFQKHTREKQPTRTHGNVVIRLIDKQSQPVSNVEVFLNDYGDKTCYSAITNADGKAYLFVGNNKNYWLSFNDFQNHSEVKLPQIPYLNLTQEVYYAPPRVTETNSNDTILQEFEGNAQVATSRALINVNVQNLSGEPMQGYPVIVDKLNTDTVYLSYTNQEGHSYFLLPKGHKYKLKFFKEDFYEDLYFPKTSGFRTSEINYQTSGLIIDRETYENVDLVTPMAASVYEELPKTWSLKEFCPPVGDQGRYGTCVGWATAYYSYTIMNAMDRENEQPETDEEIYSPTWIYEQIKFDLDKECSMGTYIESAFDLMKNTGNMPVSEIPYACGTQITESHKQKAGDYKIMEYRRLFSWGGDDDMIINSIKKSLSENHPVVIGFKVPASFHVAGEWWEPAENDYAPLFGGNHAMTVIGYDDGKKSGAFQLINSWGEDWGDQGYIWIEYDDFAKYCFSAFEFFTSLNRKSLQADVLLKNGQNKAISDLKLNQPGQSIPSYNISSEISSGAIEFNVKGSGYLHIYGITKDNFMKRIFPSDYSKTSSFMGYSENIIHLNIHDFSDLKEVVFVLSKESIDLNEKIRQLNYGLKITNKDIFNKLNDRLHGNFKLDEGKISFSVESFNDGELIIFGVNLLK